MAIEEIVAIVKPPKHPVETGVNEVRAEEVQGVLGLVLPDDLLQISNRYGSGIFSDSSVDITVFNPFASTYIDTINAECDILRDFKEMRGDVEVPYSVYPDSKGLFPWGGDNNGNAMFFLTEGMPGNWPIVLQTRDGDFQELEMSITSFLAKSFKREIKRLSEKWSCRKLCVCWILRVPLV